jgi:hypothetical protein
MNAAICQHVHCGLDADAYDDEVAFKTKAPLCDYGGNAPRSLEPDDRILENSANTVSAMEVSDGLADRFAQDAEERRLRWVARDHVQAPLPERRSHFRANEPHAHNDDSATGHHLFPNAIGVLHRTKTVNAFKIATGNRDTAVAAPRGDEQRVEGQATMILQFHESR